MFVSSLLLRRSPLQSAVGGVALLAATGGALYAFKNKIPHPSEFEIIGCCCLRGGCHKHSRFNLIVEIQECSNIPKGSPVYFYVKCGRFDNKSSNCEVNSKTGVAFLYERVHIHVRQKDDTITLSIYRKGAIRSTLLGSLTLDIMEEIIGKNYPQRQTYVLRKDGKNTVKALLSFHRMNTEYVSTVSPLTEYALIRATREALEKDQNCDLNIDALDEYEKIIFLSCALEGPLEMLVFNAWKKFYFKAVLIKKKKWHWSYWNSKEDLVRGKNPTNSIPLLAVSIVLPDKKNRSQFYVKYHTQNAPVDLFFRRVDRDRDIWSNCLYEFLELLRQNVNSLPSETTLVPSRKDSKPVKVRNASLKKIRDSSSKDKDTLKRTVHPPLKRKEDLLVLSSKGSRFDGATIHPSDPVMEIPDELSKAKHEECFTIAKNVSDFKKSVSSLEETEEDTQYDDQFFFSKEGDTGGPL